ncbi:DNA methyltransferase like protein pmt1 [Cyphomyrmex costatus]|uniref:tRNA (cytosine(38)-C(5))-methyltransferase n=1 Tax=Cyphomyrmex costatus TaxID=456900 RepID=A0A151IJ19_9HYME|nr:DNA methyltransferase like protein pmt1 [Cyphomyrmex costatus]
MNRNIQSINAQELNKLNVDIIFMSPPCQPFTRLGLKKDVLDNRTCSLQHILNLIPELKNLRYILLENVKGFEISQMRDRLVECIESCGYAYRELILSPCQFGIPNSRHRYYLLAKKNNLQFCLKQSLCYTLNNILENIEDSKYLVPSKLLQKRAWVLDIRTSESNGSCCFTKGYSYYTEGTGSVYCPLTDEIIRKKYNEITNYENDSNKQMQILSDLKLRFFSPKEVCRLMCFPEDFHFPEHITDKQKYRLLGNSINIHVVSRLILLLCTEHENI